MLDDPDVDEEEEGLSDLDSSCSLNAAQWKPRLRLQHGGFVAAGAATTGGTKDLHQS